MGVEYYLIKPRTKEMIHLGKHRWGCLEGISISRVVSKPWYKGDYEAQDIVYDMIQAGCYDGEDTMDFLFDLANTIYEFILDEEVRIANDCEEDAEWLNAYTEITSIHDIAREHYNC